MVLFNKNGLLTCSNNTITNYFTLNTKNDLNPKKNKKDSKKTCSFFKIFFLKKCNLFEIIF